MPLLDPPLKPARENRIYRKSKCSNLRYRSCINQEIRGREAETRRTQPVRWCYGWTPARVPVYVFESIKWFDIMKIRRHTSSWYESMMLSCKPKQFRKCLSFQRLPIPISNGPVIPVTIMQLVARSFFRGGIHIIFQSVIVDLNQVTMFTIYSLRIGVCFIVNDEVDTPCSVFKTFRTIF